MRKHAVVSRFTRFLGLLQQPCEANRASDAKFKAAVIAVIAERRLLKLGNVRIVERANTLSEEQLESAFPSKESATSTGQPHLKKVASLTSSGLDKTEYKGKACDEKPASGGWFS